MGNYEGFKKDNEKGSQPDVVGGQPELSQQNEPLRKEDTVQAGNQKENPFSFNKDMMQSAMKDLQQKINEAKSGAEKGQTIQNAVFDMMEKMGIKIPPKVLEKMKNIEGKK